MSKRFLTQFIFNAYDIFHGRRVSKVCKKIESSYYSKPTRVIEFKEYQNYWIKKGVDYKGLPTSKQLIKEYLNRTKPDNVHSWAYTGGSHGEPLKVPYSKERSLLRTSTFKFFNELGGYQIGDSFALIRAKNKGLFSKILRNETIFIPHEISSTKIEKFVKILIDKKIKFLLGYPTVMHELALFLVDHPEMADNLAITSLISTSEMLENEKRLFVKEVICDKFLDRYANEEVGLIAQQENFSGPYFVNPLNVIVEVLDPNTFKPVKENEVGKVYVTDVENRLVPMIRYDTGDLAVAGQYKNNELFTLKHIIGRDVERIYDTNGQPVSSLALGPLIYKPLSQESSLISFQFSQVASDKYVLRLKAPGNIVRGRLSDKIIDNLKGVLGDNAQITPLYIDFIPTLPSGKRPIYVNEMDGNKITKGSY